MGVGLRQGPGNGKYSFVLHPSAAAERLALDRMIENFQRQERERSSTASSGPSTFQALLRGAAIGVSGVDAPLMNEDGSDVNTLDVLNAAGDRLARQNAAGQERLQATLAQASNAGSNGSSQPASAASNRSSGPPAQADAKSAARRTMYCWCWATNGSRAVYMSGVGSRSVSTDEQQRWRASMDREFAAQLRGPYQSLQCDIDDDNDFSFTRNSISADGPVLVQWAPH
jgi:hypothetical protein